MDVPSLRLLSALMGLWLVSSALPGCYNPAPEPAASGGGSTIATSAGVPIASAAAGSDAVVEAAPEVSVNAGPLRAEIVANAVPAGGEQHICVVIPLDNTEPVWVNHIQTTLSDGSHHLIVDRLSDKTPPQLEPKNCGPTVGGDSTRLVIAQQPETVVTLPPQVAFKLAPHQPVFLQLHYINLTDASLDIRGAVELFPTDAAGPTPIEAKSRFTGATQINIPAKSPGTVTSFIKPPVQKTPIHIFAMTSHTHRLGVHSIIERVSDQAAPATEPLHESLDWAEPPLSLFDPPLAFNGSDGLRLTCDYMNDTDEPVTFGVLAEQEMCFMWLYYYEQ